MGQKWESATSAVQTADLLYGNLRELHKQACEKKGVLPIITLDLIRDAAALLNRIKEVEGVLNQS
jgi:hypothetical protein